MTKYIIFGWSRDSLYPDELVGTYSYEKPPVSEDGLQITLEDVTLHSKLFQGKTFPMYVGVSTFSGKKVIAYYAIPETTND